MGIGTHVGMLIAASSGSLPSGSSPFAESASKATIADFSDAMIGSTALAANSEVENRKRTTDKLKEGKT